MTVPHCVRLRMRCQVATFIVQKILLDEMGLNYICATAERFYAVCLAPAVAYLWCSAASDAAWVVDSRSARYPTPMVA